MVKEGSSTLRELYMSHWDQTGEKPEALDYPQCPEELRYLWNDFLQLSRGRANGGFGPSPLSFTEIEAWCRLSRTRLSAFEFNTIKVIDSTYIESQAKSS